MKLRYLLLASTVLPLAMNYPVLALERTSSPILLAQADQPPCPEGQECPPVEGLGTGGEAPADQPPPEQAAPEQAPPQDVAPQPAEEQPAPEPPALEQPAPPQDVVPQEPAAGLPPAEQPAPEPAPPQDIAPQEPAADQPQPAPPQDVVPEVQPPDQPQPAPEQPAPVQPSPDQAASPPQDAPPVEDTTVEQQLDAQGDQGEANNVRTLRERLQQQLQDAVAIPPEEGGPPADQGNANNRDRRGDHNNGWWDRNQGNDVVERRGGRIVIDLGNGNLSVEPVAPDEGGRLLYGADDVEVQNLPRGQTRTIVHRRNGVDIVTVRDRYGDIVKRSKILPDGTEIVLIDNRFPDDYQGGRPPVLFDVPPPVVSIPQDQYIVDYGNASEDDVRSALRAPLVQQIARPYTLDEVLQNQQVRAYSPRIDLDAITFETGSATIGNDQMRALFNLGQAMEQVIAENPDELYLIEGHTDAVGSARANLILSDQRAEAVATALSQNFEIPPENLVTQGYGEEYLEVNTDGAERRNRRAAVRRLTELLQAQSQ